MAVERIEEYSITGVAKVFIKPTKAFPNGGWFYCDIEHLNIVKERSWYLNKFNNHCIYIQTHTRKKDVVLYHQLLAEKVLNYIPNCIDHISGLTIDNTDKNLNVVTIQQNSRNRPNRGYIYSKGIFTPSISDNSITCKDISHKSEAGAALGAYFLRQRCYSDYNFDFLKDRRNDLDIVDLQYTGQISEEEATFRHVMRYARDNAWYVYRYNLFNYFKYYHIKTPSFKLNELGFMIHPITGQKLCPFYK